MSRNYVNLGSSTRNLVILFDMRLSNTQLSILLYITITIVEGWLLFPEHTVLQITASVSSPVELKDMKLYFDWGFQVNYNLPYTLKHFYDIPKWPGHSKAIERSIFKDKYLMENATHPSDLTAGNIYSVIEATMVEYGFHETCLLKSVCEVAKHPFDLSEENLLAEIISFILSPSLHRAFGSDEKRYRVAYESAERYGANGVDCDFIYPECPLAVVNVITKILLY